MGHINFLWKAVLPLWFEILNIQLSFKIRKPGSILRKAWYTFPRQYTQPFWVQVEGQVETAVRITIIVIAQILIIIIDNAIIFTVLVFNKLLNNTIDMMAGHNGRRSSAGSGGSAGSCTCYQVPPYPRSIHPHCCHHYQCHAAATSMGASHDPRKLSRESLQGSLVHDINSNLVDPGGSFILCSLLHSNGSQNYYLGVAYI